MVETRTHPIGTITTCTDQPGREIVANANDVRQAIIGLLQASIFITSGVLILMWIYRANLNAHRLGAAGMVFSPGWAVGWYFIPFANLWKPYQAMREIWQASASPQRWESEHRPWFLPLWWTLWIVTSLFDNAAFRMSLRNDPGIDQLITASGVTIVSDVLGIPLAVVFFVLVHRIHRMQIEQSNLQVF